MTLVNGERGPGYVLKRTGAHIGGDKVHREVGRSLVSIDGESVLSIGVLKKPLLILT